MKPVLSVFLSGAITMAYLVSALFFLRFWRDTRDRLFLFFTSAFFLFAVQRTLLTLARDEAVFEVAVYALRLAAFLVIGAGLIDKNRKA